MLQLCADGHEEICHDGECPACAALVKVKDAEEQGSAALAERDELRSTVNDLQEKLDHLQARLDTSE